LVTQPWIHAGPVSDSYAVVTDSATRPIKSGTAVTTPLPVYRLSVCVSSESRRPPTTFALTGRHVVVVLRAFDYRQDLRGLRTYLKEKSPVLVGVGVYTVTCSGASDGAGNSGAASATLRSIYRWDGFLQPINDTAHQIDTATSTFKAGSTVPVKFELKRADGTIITPAGAPVWLAPVKGSATTASVDESVYTVAATSGGTYRADGTQWIYNWSTKGLASGFYYRIGVKLDDGQTYYVNIGLR